MRIERVRTEGVPMARTLLAAAGTVAALFVTVLASAGQAPGSGAGTASASLDFDYFIDRTFSVGAAGLLRAAWTCWAASAITV